MPFLRKKFYSQTAICEKMTYSRFKTFQQFQAMGGVIIRGSRVIICMENNTTPSIMQTTAPDRVCIPPQLCRQELIHPSAYLFLRSLSLSE